MLDVTRPVIVAPMAGGPSTPALVNAATAAGATGFLAAGYKSPQAVEDELRAVDGAYGLNIFVPGPPPPDVAALERYRALLQAEADRYGFTFGVPERAVVAALQDAGSRVLITVTNASEAARALAVGPDALIVQDGSADLIASLLPGT